MIDIKPSAKKTLFILGIICFIGLILRLIYFDRVTFGYDQARDALESISIIKDKNIKLIGPTTDIRGLFHSPLYWYIVSPFYYFSGGNPEIARIPMIFTNLLNILFIYYLAKKILRDEKVALLSSLFMAVSFEVVQYARWLSNPPPALLTTALFFYGLWLSFNKKAIGLPLMIFFWSISVNFQVFLIYQIVFILTAITYLFIKNKKIIIESIKHYYWLYILSTMSFSFYILAQVKFKFLGVKSLINFILYRGETKQSFLPKIFNFINRLIDNIAFNITANNVFLAKAILILVVGFVIFHLIKKNKYSKIIFFLFIWLISPIVIYPLEKNNSYFLNIGNIYPLILLIVIISVALSEKLKKLKYILLSLIMIGIVSANLYLIIEKNKYGETLFSVQYNQTLSDEKQIIDYVYLNSKNEIFAFNTLTNPLYMNTTWAYLFNWYGKSKYSYMPVWWGAYLDDFGKEIQFSNSSKLKEGNFIYLIVEPPVFHQSYINAYSQFEDSRSKLIKKMNVGNHVVETRVIKQIKDFSRDELTNLLPH